MHISRVLWRPLLAQHHLKSLLKILQISSPPINIPLLHLHLRLLILTHPIPPPRTYPPLPCTCPSLPPPRTPSTPSFQHLKFNLPSPLLPSTFPPTSHSTPPPYSSPHLLITSLLLPLTLLPLPTPPPSLLQHIMYFLLLPLLLPLPLPLPPHPRTYFSSKNRL